MIETQSFLKKKLVISISGISSFLRTGSDIISRVQLVSPVAENWLFLLLESHTEGNKEEERGCCCYC